VLATLTVLGLTTTALPRAGGAGRLNVTPFYVGRRRTIVPLWFAVVVPSTVVRKVVQTSTIRHRLSSSVSSTQTRSPVMHCSCCCWTAAVCAAYSGTCPAIWSSSVKSIHPQWPPTIISGSHTVAPNTRKFVHNYSPVGLRLSDSPADCQTAVFVKLRRALGYNNNNNNNNSNNNNYRNRAHEVVAKFRWEFFFRTNCCSTAH